MEVSSQQDLDRRMAGLSNDVQVHTLFALMPVRCVSRLHSPCIVPS